MMAALTEVQRHASAVQGARLYDIGDALVAPVRHQELQGEADHQSAQGRGEEDVPPGELAQLGIHVLGGEAVKQGLHEPQELAKADRAVGDGDANDHREDGKDELIVADKAAPAQDNEPEPLGALLHF